jgi:hypothetical protein
MALLFTPIGFGKNVALLAQFEHLVGIAFCNIGCAGRALTFATTVRVHVALDSLSSI